MLFTILTTALAATVPTEPPAAAIRIDQAGYETRGGKIAIVPASQTTPLPWTLRDGSGRTTVVGCTGSSPRASRRSTRTT